MTAGRRARAGFTLLEMLAVIFLMSVVLWVATDVYLDMSRASNAAVERTRNARRAVLLLDRVARDLEGTVLLVKPDDVDPLEHPWLFLAEAAEPDAGADHVKFVRRGRPVRASDAPESDLELVAWMAVEGPDGDLEVRRWSWPQLPEGLDRRFPEVEETDVVAGGLAAFGIRFQDDAGEWTSRWDSSTLVGSSELPTAAEIEVAFWADPESDAIDGPYTRQVVLPMRPIDLAALLDAGQDGTGGPGQLRDLDGDGDVDADDEAIAEEREQASNDDEQDCVTVAMCLQDNPGLQTTVNSLDPAIRGMVQDVIQGSLGACARDVAGMAQGLIPASCMQ